MIYIVFAVIFLHFISLPILVGAHFSIDTEKNELAVTVKLFFIPVYSVKRDIKKVLDEAESKKGKEKDGGGEKSAFKRYIIALGLKLIKRIRVRTLDADGVIGAGDAAASALAVGGLRVVISDCRAVFGCGGSGEINPNYDEERIFLRFNGIISLCIADIIFASLSAVPACISGGKHKERRVYGHANP